MIDVYCRETKEQLDSLSTEEANDWALAANEQQDVPLENYILHFRQSGGYCEIQGNGKLDRY